MKYLVFAIALLFSGAVYAAPDCSNYGGTNLEGCSAPASAAVAVEGQNQGDRNEQVEHSAPSGGTIGDGIAKGLDRVL